MSIDFVKFTLLKKISPDVGLSRRAIRCNNVDLPDPDGPTKDTKSPLLMLKFIFLITSILPNVPEYFFDKLDIFII